MHKPSKTLHKDDNIHTLVEHLRTEEVVVFHCMYSQFRGPQSAQAYKRALGDSPQQVLVLEGGFVQFFRTHHASSGLLEPVGVGGDGTCVPESMHDEQGGAGTTAYSNKSD